jgi:hypothetical protein
LLSDEEIKLILDDKSQAVPTIFLEKSPKSGSTGLVYRSLDRKLAVKISHSDRSSREAVRNEAEMYDHLTSKVHAKKVHAKMYGIFRIGTDDLVLVLSNEGGPVHFDSLSNADRQVGTGGSPARAFLISLQGLYLPKPRSPPSRRYRTRGFRRTKHCPATGPSTSDHRFLTFLLPRMRGAGSLSRTHRRNGPTQTKPESFPQTTSPRITILLPNFSNVEEEARY